MSFLDYDDDLYNLTKKMNPRQRRLFACDCAEHVLWIYENHNPTDKRPRALIQTLRQYANNKVSDEEVNAAVDEVNNAINENTQPSVKFAAMAAQYAFSSDLHLVQEVNKPTTSAIARWARDRDIDPIEEAIEFRKWQIQRAQAILDGLYDQE